MSRNSIEDNAKKPGLIRRLILWAACLYPVGLLALTAANLLYPQRNGPLAFSEIFAPYFFLPLVLLVPFAFMRGSWPLRALLLACGLVWVVRYFPQINRERAANLDATQVTVISWNVMINNPRLSEILNYLYTGPADVVALHEAHGDWAATDTRLAETYPHRLTFPQGCPPGSALLSKYPMVGHSGLDMQQSNERIPRMCFARLDLGGGEALTVIGAHPYPPSGNCRVPLCVDPTVRDGQIARIRESAFIGNFLLEQMPFLLIGDFNVTEREPAYGELSAGLRDAHREVGAGAGSTWAPISLMSRGIPLLRIDYLFSSPNVIPLSMNVDCTPRGSDHCLLTGKFEMP